MNLISSTPFKTFVGTPVVPPMPSEWRFGEFDSHLTPGQSIVAANGNYSAIFNVTDGIITLINGATKTPGSYDVDGTTVHIVANGYTAMSVLEAATLAQGATSARVVMLRSPATYIRVDSSADSLFSFIDGAGGQTVTITSSDRIDKALLQNHYFHSQQQSQDIVIENLRFAITREYIDANGTKTFIDDGFQCSGWTIRDCEFSGGSISQAELESTSYPSGGFDLPNGLDISQVGVVVEDCVFTNCYLPATVLVDGALSFQRNTASKFYLDSFRFLTPNNSGDTTALKQIKDNVVYYPFGMVNEAGADTPHPDGMQFINSGSAINPGIAYVEITGNQIFGSPVATRNDSMQGLFIKTKMDNCQIGYNLIGATNESAGIYLGETGPVTDVAVIHCTIAETNWGSTETNLRINQRDGDIRVLNSITTRTVDDVSPTGGALTITNTTVNALAAGYSNVFNGSASPTTAAEQITSLTPKLGSAAYTNNQGALTNAGAFRTVVLLPYRPAAPTLADTGGGVTVTLPADPRSPGAAIASWDVRWSVAGADSWTTVTSYAGAEIATGSGSFDVQARAVNSMGAGFWSSSATQVVA